jgi:hypothetical protein
VIHALLAELLRARRLSVPGLVASWAAQLLAAAIMGQTLVFKFTASPEPVYIFSTLGVEPWGRLATAVFELVAVVLLLIPRLAVVGAMLGVGLMLGAIGSHLAVLGIVVKDDGGLLFGMAVVTLAACGTVVAMRADQLRAAARAALSTRRTTR